MSQTRIAQVALVWYCTPLAVANFPISVHPAFEVPVDFFTHTRDKNAKLYFLWLLDFKEFFKEAVNSRSRQKLS